MDMTQAHALLDPAFLPERTIFVECETASYSTIDGSGSKITRFSVSLVPGLDGGQCSIWRGTNLAELVDLALKAAPAVRSEFAAADAAIASLQPV